MIRNNPTLVFAFEKSTDFDPGIMSHKYMVKSYNVDGSINYFDENDPCDGFHEIIEKLNKEGEAEMLVSNPKMIPIIEFINDLKYSVMNAKLTFKFKSSENYWKEVSYYF